ncbi:ABC transporter periplasmic substrate-binding component [Candidatus Rickettsiella viridis]|uniref:ABC transporter periplasmic substrate-binding component n=1 Tax=Candidatus Rickettsiella viridis TaxID=676208 RepID=A0A2Z5UX42_9COXI|nr:ABC transporter substrate-binding protein [Candidatus Rickettsiella viridis]BBB15715.1 ABC transporter periplasmic substrate-binding component [Candidatus Rickettsiella viridis]
MPKITRFVFMVLFLMPNYVNAKPLTLILDWLVNPNHAAIFIAQEQGFFRQQGINVNIIVPAEPDDGAKLVAAGRADLAITYQPQLVVQAAQGLPLVRMATLIDKPLNCLVVRKESGIDSIADLKGKKIGYTSNVEGTLALETLLKKAGLTLKDVEAINIQYNLTQALLSKRVDAIVNVMRNVEPLQLQFSGQPVTLFPVDAVMPSYDELIIVTNHHELTDPRLKKFLIALQQASDYLLKNPEKSWQLFAKNNPTLNNELTHQIWQTTLSYLARHPAQLNQENYQSFSYFLYEQKVVPRKMPIQNYAIQIQPLK